jgi:hypothetical protein
MPGSVERSLATVDAHGGRIASPRAAPFELLSPDPPDKLPSDTLWPGAFATRAIESRRQDPDERPASDGALSHRDMLCVPKWLLIECRRWGGTYEIFAPLTWYECASRFSSEGRLKGAGRPGSGMPCELHGKDNARGGRVKEEVL